MAKKNKLCYYPIIKFKKSKIKMIKKDTHNPNMNIERIINIYLKNK